jgi:hypothetical protein
MAEVGARTKTIIALHQDMHDAFNDRDWDRIGERISPVCVYIDHARNETARGPEECVALYRSWTEAFSDGEIVGGALYDGLEDLSICRFIGRGTQDGPLGPFPPTGLTSDTAFCEFLRFDDDGLVVAGEVYYDQLGLLMQLGHIPDMSQ